MVMTTLGVEPGTTAGIVDRAWQILAGVVDPEIPAISIVDLGIVGRVTVAGGRLEVELLPTFIGCPALDMIRTTVSDELAPLVTGPGSGIERVVVSLSFAVPWTAGRITEHGRRALAASGFAPPGLALAGLPPAGLPAGPGAAPIEVAPRATCPYCGSRRTVLENAFGPTRCRSIHYCTDCRQPFEQFKDG
jgi:ring-1,2-phenylacetyl-CoA epoxidase subunit PaaD